MVKPVAPACGHLGCRHCLAILVGIENVLKCPLCKAPIGKGAALHVNIALDDIIGNFDVNCKNSGCLWTGKFHAHEQHFKIRGKFEMQCANKGCREVLAREGMAAHISHCAKQKVPCQECGRKVHRECFKEHAAFICLNVRISCPLSCGTSLPR